MRFARFVLAASSSVALAGVLLGLPACSDPVPPVAQGAWTATFIAPDSNCTVVGHNANVGAVTPNTKDKLIVDGIDSATISCTVRPVGGGAFAVDADLSYQSATLRLKIGSISPTATKDKPAAGAIGFVTGTTVNAYQSPVDTPCNFYFGPGTPEGVAAGKLWVQFDCPKLNQAASVCGLNGGNAIMENCTIAATPTAG